MVSCANRIRVLHTRPMWWWIGAGLLLWVMVSIAVALLIGRIVSHADLEDEAETVRRNEHLRSKLFRRTR